MKKTAFFILLFLMEIGNVFASDRITVKLNKCVDGDTAKFTLNNTVITARFLAIDTPESVHPTKPVESYGKEASNYTCDKLSKANKIEIEYDDNSDRKDKYNRDLVWVWVNDYLLQDDLVKEGYAEVAYLYADYKYTPLLKDHEEVAKANKLKIWSDNQTEKQANEDNNNTLDNNTLIIIVILLCTLACIFSSKYRNKTIKKVKRKINNKINKSIDDLLK